MTPSRRILGDRKNMREYEIGKGIALLSEIARALAERGIAFRNTEWSGLKRDIDTAVETWRRANQDDGVILHEKSVWNVYNAIGRLAASALRNEQIEPTPEAIGHFLTENVVGMLRAAKDIVESFPDAAGGTSVTNIRAAATEGLRIAFTPSQIISIVAAAEHLIGRPSEHPATRATIEHAIRVIVDRVDGTAAQLAENGIMRASGHAKQIRNVAFEAVDLAHKSLRCLRQDPGLYPTPNAPPLMDCAIRKMAQRLGRDLTNEENDHLVERVVRAVAKRFDALFREGWEATERLNAKIAAALAGKPEDPQGPSGPGGGGTGTIPTDETEEPSPLKSNLHKAFGKPRQNN